ncbi:MAG TPA: hypothetical protein VIJ38_13505 [Acidobacteriaceae bacterium]
MLVSIDSYRGVKFVLRYLREVPLAWFILGIGIARVGVFLSTACFGERRFVWLRRCAFAVGLLILCAYLAITLDSLRCFLIQQDEANIISIAAASLRGLPMYHSPSSANLSYSLMYGPFTFLIYRVALVAGGINHFWVMRGAVVIASLAVCATLFLLLRKFVSNFIAVALLTFPLSILLQHPENSMSIRSDIWIVLFSALAMLASFLEAELLAVILTGILGGVIIGLKISAAPAILFPLLVLYRRFGLRATAYCLLTVVAFTLAPFALPNVSLHNYIAWILFTRSEGLSASSAFSNVLFALFLVSPCLMMELYMRRFGLAFRHRVPEILIIVLCLLMAVMTSKHGSGLHYLWHIVPSIVVYMALVARDIAATIDEEREVPIYSIAVACTLFACVYIPRAYGYVKISLMPPGVAVARQSIDRYLDLYRDHSSIQMGYGSVDGDYHTELRYVLVYRDQPYTLEGNTARFETKLLPFPVNVLKQMDSCKDDVWLVPHGEKPFDLWVFRDSLRTTFLRDYAVDRTDGVYDAWVCNPARARSMLNEK